MDCLFCKIVNGEIPSKKIYEDDSIYIFEDIQPQAKHHFLAIPKKHIGSAAEVGAEDEETIGHIFSTVAKLAEELGIEGGFRIITNAREHGGQTVGHLHFHILGGEQLPMNII